MLQNVPLRPLKSIFEPQKPTGARMAHDWRKNVRRFPLAILIAPHRGASMRMAQTAQSMRRSRVALRLRRRLARPSSRHVIAIRACSPRTVSRANMQPATGREEKKMEEQRKTENFAVLAARATTSTIPFKGDG